MGNIYRVRWASRGFEAEEAVGIGWGLLSRMRNHAYPTWAGGGEARSLRHWPCISELRHDFEVAIMNNEMRRVSPQDQDDRQIASDSQRSSYQLDRVSVTINQHSSGIMKLPQRVIG